MGSEPPDDSFTSNSFLKISNSQLFPKFLHDCCDELVEGKQIDLKNYNSDDIEWTNDDVALSKNVIQTFYVNSTLNENFNLGTNISQKVCDNLRECYNIRKEDIEQFLIKQSFLKLGHNIVENVDWKLKWVICSSKFAKINEPLLQLDLRCAKKDISNDKTIENNVDFELNLEQVDYLIKVLEDVKKKLC